MSLRVTVSDEDAVYTLTFYCSGRPRHLLSANVRACMSTSLFFEIPAASESAFLQAKSLDDWYEAVGAAGVDTAPTFDGEDSAWPWQYAIAASNFDSPIRSLFVGDLRSGLEGSGDPAIVFHRPASVKNIAKDLRARGESQFQSILSESGNKADIWMYKHLLAFFETAAGNENSVVLLWSV